MFNRLINVLTFPLRSQLCVAVYIFAALCTLKILVPENRTMMQFRLFDQTQFELNTFGVSILIFVIGIFWMLSLEYISYKEETYYAPELDWHAWLFTLTLTFIVITGKIYESGYMYKPFPMMPVRQVMVPSGKLIKTKRRDWYNEWVRVKKLSHFK